MCHAVAEYVLFHSVPDAMDIQSLEDRFREEVFLAVLDSLLSALEQRPKAYTKSIKYSITSLSLAVHQINLLQAPHLVNPALYLIKCVGPSSMQ